MSRQNNNIRTEPQMNPNPNSGPMPTNSRTNHRIPNMTMKRTIIALLYTLGALLASSIAVEAATLLPPGKNCFNDANGDPLAAGTVGMYIPTTMTAKDTWTDAGESTLNIDPVPLDSAGCAIIYGNGTYRQIVKDSLGNTIWDQLTASTGNQTGVILYGGTSTGSANAQSIVVSGFTATDGQLVSFIAGFTNTGATTVDAGTGGIAVRFDSTSGPVALTGGEIHANNVVVMLYTGGFFHLVGTTTATNHQVFIGAGTWTKPGGISAGSMTHIQCWGSGGGGGANATGGGGGGGAMAEGWFLTSSLAATESVTIAAGGAISTSGTGSSFGTINDYVIAEGGGAGQNAANGGGGGGGGSAGNGIAGAATNGGRAGLDQGAAGGVAPANGTYGVYGGGGGGGTTATAGTGGAAQFGGGGGGGGTNTGGGVAGAGGASVYGGGGGSGGGAVSGGGGVTVVSGFGGNGGDSGSAGTAPGGGGGRNAAGARGECRVWTTP